ncbi:hypothetical protein G9A89_004752 [Geosiphon pyriformis]|nr:hypothetical protein G9A89_004752 [Geosiphon pyriformis]
MAIFIILANSFIDIYYDNHSKDYPLTTRDIWLRQRDEKWECKTPTNLTPSMDSYHELETIDSVTEYLENILNPGNSSISLPREDQFKEFLLEKYNLTPFCEIQTFRKHYIINNEFTLDLDTADFGHHVGEIELVVESPEKVQEAERRIAIFMKEHEWFFETSGLVLGKLSRYIGMFNPNQWECMKKSGVLDRKLFPESLDSRVCSKSLSLLTQEPKSANFSNFPKCFALLAILISYFPMENPFVRPPVSEDCVHYSLNFYLASIDPEEREAFLRETSALLFAELQGYLGDYIWQKDPFQLSIAHSETDPSSPFLYGKTRFGDCVDDEWFIVFLLRVISKKFDDIVIRVSDQDGEFLLIQSAMQLPAWLNPNNSENRILIFQGDLHIIPLALIPDTESSKKLSKNIRLEQAIDLVRKYPAETKAEESVQKAAFARSSEYPQKAIDNIHHTLCHVPHKIAHLLYHNPQLISWAIEAFYTRDPIAMKACYKMENFPPSTSITVLVKMTKTLYAQIKSQKFHPPKAFKLPPNTSGKFKAADLGMKLACGFEILFSDPYYANLSSNIQEDKDYPFINDPNWLAFHHNLVKRNYYRNEIVGSKLYKQLDTIAKEQYLKNRNPVNLSNEEFSSEIFPLKQIHQLLEQPLLSADELAAKNLFEDDDSWMNIKPMDLENILKATELGPHEKQQSDYEANENGPDLNKMVEDFENFIDFDEAGIEGAEFLDEHSSNEGESDDTEIDEDYKEPQDREIQFDPSEFLKIMRRTLDISDEEYRALANVKLKETALTHTEAINNQSETPSPIPATSSSVLEQKEPALDTDTDLESYMQVMDHELASTKVGKSFVRAPKDVTRQKKTINAPEDEDNVDDDYSPVDLDLNAVTNLLASFKAQEGLAGPAGNIMGRLGVRVLPRDIDSDDDSDFEIQTNLAE